MQAVTPPVRSGRPRNIPALTGLRFFAAIEVVLFHFSTVIPYPSRFRPFVLQPVMAVDCFFVLSGFVLYYNYHDWFDRGVSRHHVGRFFRARFARLYPMYFVALLAITPLVLSSIRTHLQAFQAVFRSNLSVATIALSWSANALALQSYLPINWIQELWNDPSWSISTEFFFYAMFPFFVAWVLSRCRSTNSLLILIPVLLAIWASVLVMVKHIVPALSFTDPAHMVSYLTYRHPLSGVWEFFIGCTVGAVIRNHVDGSRMHPVTRYLDSRLARDVGLALAMAGLVLLVMHTQDWVQWPNHVVATALLAVLIAFLASGRTFLSSLLEQRTVVLLGQSSYSLYILHWIALYILVYFRPSAGKNVPVPESVGAIVITIAVSVACFRFIEAPARRILVRDRRSGERSFMARLFLTLPTSLASAARAFRP